MPVVENGETTYRYKSNFRGSALGAELNTNSLGFRGSEWSLDKNENTYRIALIGDSFAFGFGVSFSDTFGEQLSRILNDQSDTKYEVLNFGVNGYNTIQEKSVLTNVALKYNPDMVILFPVSNDHKPKLSADSDGWLHWDGSSENKRSRVDARPTSFLNKFPYAKYVKHSKAVLYALLTYEKFAGNAKKKLNKLPNESEWMGEIVKGPVSDRLKETVFTPMENMLQILKEKDIDVVISSFCTPMDYRNTLSILSEQYEIPFVELPKQFPEVKNWPEFVQRFSLGWDTHPNAVAHKRFAGVVASEIRKRRK